MYNEDENYYSNNEFNKISIKDKLKDIWYNQKKVIIILGIVLLIFILLLVIIKPNPSSNTKYKDIERIMIINAQNYIKNNNIKDNYYVSLNNLNIKVDQKLNCEVLSGVYKDKDNYYPYLICDNYKSPSIEQIINDNKDKKVELVGSNPYIISNSTYHELGYKNDDNYKVNIKGDDIDDGLNIVTYSITNNGKYIGELKRIVIAEDVVGNVPVLTLLGEKTRAIPKGSIYSEQGYKAIDEKDGNITDKVKVTGKVNTNELGTYKLIYSVTNSRGKSTKEERTIIVNENNNIDLNITHKLDPSTTTKKSVTITVTISGNGYKNTVLPDKSESKNKEVNYTVYKNGTYDFVIYDTNNNSEVYSVTVKNIDTTPPYPTITSIEQKAGVVTINAKKNKYDIVGYYFSKENKKPTGKEMTWVEKSGTTFKSAKVPGTYYVFVKDTQNNISPSKKFSFSYLDLYNTAPIAGARENQLSTPISSLLASKNDAISNYDDFIAESVKSTGLFTREAIATAAIAITGYLWNNYNYQIPYISNVDCAAARYNDYFGINPKMGNFVATPGSERATYCKGSYVGFDCTAFVGWSMHNAGFIAENTPGSYSSCNRKPCAKFVNACGKWEGNGCLEMSSKERAYAMYNSLEIGDQIHTSNPKNNTGHVRLFLAFYDDDNDGNNDGVYTYESITPAGMHKYSFEELYNRRYWAIIKIQQYIDNPANRTCYGGDITLPKSWENYKDQFAICPAKTKK